MISPELLRRYPFFADFSYEELKRLAMAGEEWTLTAGQLLFGDGQHANNLYFLIEGEVEITLMTDEPDLENVPLSTIPSGELLGWSALVEPHIYTASARTTRHSRVIAFDALELEQMVADQPHLCGVLMKKVAQTLSRRLKDTRIQLLSLAAQPIGS
jgi:CRP-like cAMP-binding protein